MKEKLFRFAALSTIYIRYAENAARATARVVARPPRRRPPDMVPGARINKIDLFIYAARGVGARLAPQIECRGRIGICINVRGGRGRRRRLRRQTDGRTAADERRGLTWNDCWCTWWYMAYDDGAAPTPARDMLVTRRRVVGGRFIAAADDELPVRPARSSSRQDNRGADRRAQRGRVGSGREGREARSRRLPPSPSTSLAGSRAPPHWQTRPSIRPLERRRRRCRRRRRRAAAHKLISYLRRC